MSTRQPVLFLSHGSPLTALGGDELAGCWARLAGRLSRPAAILMVSAHWTTRIPMLTGGAQPETIDSARITLEFQVIVPTWR